MTPPKGIWLAITDQAVEGEWRDYFTNEVPSTSISSSTIIHHNISATALQFYQQSYVIVLENGTCWPVHRQRAKRGLEGELRRPELGFQVGRLDLRSDKWQRRSEFSLYFQLTLFEFGPFSLGLF